MTHASVLALALTVCLALSACGSETDDPAPAEVSSQADFEDEMGDDEFAPDLESRLQATLEGMADDVARLEEALPALPEETQEQLGAEIEELSALFDGLRQAEREWSGATGAERAALEQRLTQALDEVELALERTDEILYPRFE